MKVLSDSNYIIRQVGTFKTQCVHRIRLKLFQPDFPVKDVDIGDQPVYADMDRIEDSDIFDSQIPKHAETKPDLNEPETDEETPVERIIHIKSPERRQALKRDKPLNRLPNRLSITPQPEITIDDLPQNTPTVQFNNNDEIIPPIIPEHTSHQQENPPILDDRETPRQGNDEVTAPPTTTRTNKSRYTLRENPQPKRYSDFLIHEITNARSALRKTNAALQ